MNTWIQHVKKTRDKNPEMSYKQALKDASKTYTKPQKVAKAAKVKKDKKL